MNIIRMHQIGYLWLGLLATILTLATCMDPKFDPSTRMRLVLVPADATVGSVIYRLRGTDDEFDYPLQFELIADSSSSTFQIDSLPCTKYNSVCQANVVLKRRLEPGRYYDFQVSVRDTKGGMAVQSCSITATNFTTPHDIIFPHKPGIIMIPEDAKRGTELDYVISRKNPLYNKPVYLELWGSPLFAIRQKIVSPEMTEGTIFLLGPLDFEKQSVYHLTILATDAYAEPGQDSRNIAGLEVVVIVEDVQDVPPVFTIAPPVTRLPSGLLPGDKLLQVHAEDGDKGVPRELRYGLVSEGNPFTSFFDINDTSGEISLLRPIDEIAAITHIGDPVILTVIAEEVKVTREEPPAMSTTVQLAFLLPERSNSAPYFENDHYVTRIEENAPQGTALVFPDPYIALVSDDDTGKNGVFSLTLLGNNGTFEISPNVAERRANFLIRVRDNQLIDYESYGSLQFQILAQELGPATNLSAIANVTVFIDDVNDNPPVFTEKVYEVELPENATAGRRVIQVHANDVDIGIGGRVRYTQILGYLNTSLRLDAETGIITIATNNHGFDRESMPEYHLYIEARDADGTGNSAQVPLVIKMIDVNDETPIFEKALYEFILTPDLRNFTVPAIIKAIDKDAEPPNNVIRYELVYGNYEKKFALHEISGELTLREPLMRIRRNMRSQRQIDNKIDMDVFVLTARAFDLGVPVRGSTTTIRIYPPESRARTVSFIVPGVNPDRKKTEEMLSTLTGGRVLIQDIKPYTGGNNGATDLGGGNKEKSVVTATVLYDGNNVVDVGKIQQGLFVNGSTITTDVIHHHHDNREATLYKSENRMLFWLLIFLAFLIALAILTLLFCCICSWCPLYAATRKRVIRVNSTEDDVHLVHREIGVGKQSKSVQVAEWMRKREAWSAERSTDDSRTKPTRWEFSRRNNNHQKLEHETRVNIEDDDNIDDNGSVKNNNKDINNKNLKTKSLEDKHSIRIRNTKYKETSSAKEKRLNNSRTNLINEREVFVEDVVEDQENYPSVSRAPEKHQQNADDQHIDDETMRRHEIDRGSEIDYNRRSSLKRQIAEDGNLDQRDHLFIKDGNAEILRLVTRGRNEEENVYVNVPTIPAKIIQPQYIMVDNSGKEILMRRYIEEQSNGKHIIREHYQLLPGPGTYVHQTIPNEVQNLPEIYVTKSQAGSGIYHTGSGIMPHQQLLQQHQQQMLQPQLQQQQPMQQQQASEQAQEPMATQINVQESELQRTSSHHSLIHQELENSLKQQNELLRQILLDKEKLEEKYNQQELALETQSLPGQAIVVSQAIATQTDCEAGTQTDPINLRPERRRTKSENDDSQSEDEYEFVRYSPPDSPEGVYWIKRKKQKKKSKYKDADKQKKKVVTVDSVKRKIRTPIQEEEEHHRSPPKKYSEPRVYVLTPIKSADIEKAEKLSRASPGLKKEVLLEITDSLDEQIIPTIKEKRKYLTQIHLSQVIDDDDYEMHESEYSEQQKRDVNTDSVNDSPEESVQRFKTSKQNDRRNKVFSRQGSSTDAREMIKMEMEMRQALLSKERNSIPPTRQHSFIKEADQSPHKDAPPPVRPRLSRRDLTFDIMGEKRRQTASEPPFRVQKGPAPKPPDSHRLKKPVREKTKSEADMLRSIAEEGGDLPKGVPKYMEWYFNKIRDETIERKRKEAEEKQRSENEVKPKEKKPKKPERNVGNKQSSPESDGKGKPEPLPRKSPPKNARLLKEDIAIAKSLQSQAAGDKNHTLLQHSEHRFEHDYDAAGIIAPQPTKMSHYLYPETPPSVTVNKKPKSQNRAKWMNIIKSAKPSPIKENEVKETKSKTEKPLKEIKADSKEAPKDASKESTQQKQSKQLNASTLEDDHDSGIAMNTLLSNMGRRNPIRDKKSVFTIAYDDVKVKQITSECESSPSFT